MMSERGKVAMLVEDDYEDLELWYPYYRLREAGFAPLIIGPGTKDTYLSKHGYPAKVDLDVKNARTGDYVALIVPGGFAPDRMRRHNSVVEFVREFSSTGRLVASICHGPSVLISANVLQGKKATCFRSIRDDIINAGARYMDEEVVIDGSLVTSRGPADLPAFMKAVLGCLDIPSGF